jgi:REP element-mobilizing transposase RayT
MKFDPKKYRRRSIRVPGYDYSQPGAYFVTTVTYQWECLFGEVVDREMRLNGNGKVVKWEWERLLHRFPFIELGTYIVMPNHFHGILIFHESVRATRTDQIDPESDITTFQSITPDGNNGSAIVGQFKSRVTKRLWKNPDLNGTPIWQRNYYDHIIRDETEWNKIHLYIESNPINWATDEENSIHYAQ